MKRPSDAEAIEFIAKRLVAYGVPITPDDAWEQLQPQHKEEAMRKAASLYKAMQEQRIVTPRKRSVVDNLVMFPPAAAASDVYVPSRRELSYLDDIIAVGTHGSSRKEVTRVFVLEGIRRALAEDLIATRRFGSSNKRDA